MPNENENEQEGQDILADIDAAMIAAASVTAEDDPGEEEEAVQDAGAANMEEGAGQTGQAEEDPEEERELTLDDVIKGLNDVYGVLERMTETFGSMITTVGDLSAGITELSSDVTALTASGGAAAGTGGGGDSNAGPINPVILKLAVQGAMTAALPEFSRMLRGQIAAVKTDLQKAAEEDARIINNNTKTVHEYSEHRKNITQEV